MLYRLSAVTGLLLFALSGCLGEPQSLEPDDSPYQPPEVPPSVDEKTPPTETEEPVVRLNQTMVLDGCDYWWGTLYLPPGFNPAEPPQGFPEPANPLATNIDIIRFQCDRLAVQDLDRGPVSLLFEMHNNLATPKECQAKTSGTQHKAAQTILVSDGDAADRLGHVGLPTFEASMAQLPPTPSDVDLMPDEWSVEGHPSSTAYVERDGVTNEFGIPSIRLFWHDGESLWVGDLEFTGAGPAALGRVMEGSFASPMLTAEVVDRVVMETFWFVDGGATLRIQQHPGGTCDD